jgi:4-hydroxy-4-methyl-2-oxoglutarate aldolase
MTDTRLRKLGVATTYEASGREGLVAGALVRIVPGARAAGPARTALCGVNDNLVLATPESCGVALVGGLLASQAKARGAAALLVDGPVRDVDELVALGLPVWARSVCAAGAAKEIPGEVDVRVTVGGVTVEPGDVVVLDGDGAVVVPRARRDEVLAAAEARFAYERELELRLEAGASTLEAMGLGGGE